LSSESPLGPDTQLSTLQCREYKDPTATRGEGDFTYSTRRGLGRPPGLVVVAVVWGIGAVYNIIISFLLYGPQVDLYSQFLEPTMWVQDVTMRLFLVLVSALQVVVAYEVVKGSTWSYFGGLGISAIELAIYAEIVSLYYSAPTILEFRTPLLLASLGLSAAYAALIWVYFNIPQVRKYLTRWL